MELNTINSTGSTDKSMEIASRTEHESLLEGRTGEAATVTNTESAEEPNFQNISMCLLCLKLGIPVPKWFQCFCLILLSVSAITWMLIQYYLNRDPTEQTTPATLSPIWFEARIPSRNEPLVKDAVLMLNNKLDAYEYQHVSVVIRLNGDLPSVDWTSAVMRYPPLPSSGESHFTLSIS